MKQFFLVTFFVLSALVVKAQIQYSPIMEREQGIFKKKIYTRCDVDMTADQLMMLLAKDSPMDNHVMRMAKSRIVERIFFATGSVFLSLPLVDAIQGQDPNWKLACVGAAALAVSIPFRVAFNRRAHQAVNYYNSGYNSNANAMSMELSCSPTGFGLKFRLP
ncbi:MAG: hypothetical protein ACK5JS_07590 [Mangrovibacterium sp.]